MSNYIMTQMTTLRHVIALLLLINLVLVVFVYHQLSNDIEAEALANASFERHLNVEIWSKAAIGQFLWETILASSVQSIDQFYLEGSKQISNITFTFRSGPSLKLESLPYFTLPNLILVQNWRSQEKVNYAKRWLDAIQSIDNIQNVGIIALGNEQCQNHWFENYLQSMSKIKFAYVVYDWNQIDDQMIFQWPLGTATYRDFPPSDSTSLDLQTPRPYLCNFIATIYPGSSREELNKLFDSSEELKRRCLIKVRSKWSPTESDESMKEYVESLKRSHLTLSPIGHNHECYRILEAVEYGSVPVIELNPSLLGDTSCDQHQVLRVFQKHHAPFIYVTNWTTHLASILEQQARQSASQMVKQRVQLVKWYHRFKMHFRSKLVNSVHKKFT